MVGWHLAHLLGVVFTVLKNTMGDKDKSAKIYMSTVKSLIQIRKSATQMNWPLSAFITRNDPRSLY